MSRKPTERTTSRHRPQPSLNVPLTQAQRKVIAELLPELADRLKLEEKKSCTISFSPQQLGPIGEKAKVALPHATDGMKRNSLRHVVDAVTKAIENTQGIGSIPASQRIYQFKITLIESQPAIWRRIQVRNYSLDKFHERIQTAMGWTNIHVSLRGGWVWNLWGRDCVVLKLRKGILRVGTDDAEQLADFLKVRVASATRHSQR